MRQLAVSTKATRRPAPAGDTVVVAATTAAAAAAAARSIAGGGVHAHARAGVLRMRRAAPNHSIRTLDFGGMVPGYENGSTANARLDYNGPRASGRPRRCDMQRLTSPAQPSDRTFCSEKERGSGRSEWRSVHC